METKIDKKEIEKIKESGKISIKEGSAAAMMDGFGTRYITPYALALGASNVFIALINTLPSLLGNLNQLHTLRLLKKRSRKHIVFISVLFQALLWLPIIGIGVLYLFFEERSLIPLLLLITYTFMIVAGSTSSPAWNSWMKDLIRVNKGKYFGIRNKTVSIVTIISMLTAGFILTFFSGNKILYGFFIIFSFAFLGRLISAYLFTKQYEPSFTYDVSSYFSLRQFLKRIFQNNFGRFVIFVSLISFATAVAGPFFAVYMLKDLKLSYINFTLITISSVITTIIFLPSWGSFADKFGNVKVLKTTSLLIPLVPFLWLLTIPLRGYGVFVIVFYLMILEFFSGFIWAGFNLSTSMFIYDAVTRQRLAFCIAYFNIINSSGVLIGAFIGGLIASKISYFGLNSIILLFIISGSLRLIFSLIMHNAIKEVREVPSFGFRKYIRKKFRSGKIIIWRYIGLKPVRIES